MSAVKTIAALFLAVTLLAGCESKPSDTTPTTDEGASAQPAEDQDGVATVDEAADEAADEVVDEVVDADDEVEGATQENAKGGAAEPDSALVSKTVPATSQQATPPAASTPPVPPTPRRVIFFGARSPIVVDLYVAQGERPLDELALESAEAVLTDSDADEDGSTSWEEVTGYSGTSRNDNMMRNLPRGRQRDILFRSYDSNANGSVDADEYIRFYNRGQTGVDWLVLRTTLNVTSSEIAAPLGRWVDVDRNGKLDAKEIEFATDRLLLKDSNDDGVLQASEFRDARSNRQFALNPQNNTPANAIPAFVVTDDVEWSELLYRIQRSYTFGAQLLADDTGDWPKALQDLDEDGDGTIWDHELAIISDREADLQVWFHLPSFEDYRRAYEEMTERDEGAPYEKPALGKVAIFNGQGEPLEPPSTSVPVDTEAGTLVFALSDDYMNSQYAEQLDQSFDRLDSDDDDVLSEAEFAFLAQVLRMSFAEVDTDEDGKVTKEELEQGFSPMTRLATMRIELWMLPQADPVFTALDQDHSSQLDMLEIEAASDRLAELDADGDGIVQSTETDFGTFIVLRNASPAGVAGPPTPAKTSPQQSQHPGDVPSWFRATDANRDGVIGRREFLGDTSFFEQLDQDGDGALSPDEATAAE